MLWMTRERCEHLPVSPRPHVFLLRVERAVPDDHREREKARDVARKGAGTRSEGVERCLPLKRTRALHSNSHGNYSMEPEHL